MNLIEIKDWKEKSKEYNKMIKIYYRSNCGSSRRALEWFQSYNIEVQKHKITDLNQKDLFTLLKLSDGGIEGIIKKSQNNNFKTNRKLISLMEMTFNDALYFLISHPGLLRTPIIFDDRKCIIGYNSEEIRTFFPKIPHQ